MKGGGSLSHQPSSSTQERGRSCRTTLTPGFLLYAGKRWEDVALLSHPLSSSSQERGGREQDYSPTRLPPLRGKEEGGRRITHPPVFHLSAGRRCEGGRFISPAFFHSVGRRCEGGALLSHQPSSTPQERGTREDHCSPILIPPLRGKEVEGRKITLPPAFLLYERKRGREEHCSPTHLLPLCRKEGIGRKITLPPALLLFAGTRGDGGRLLSHPPSSALQEGGGREEDYSPPTFVLSAGRRF